MNADSIKIESDEDGFHLIVVTDAAHHDFNIHGVADVLHEQVNLIIGGWLAEGESTKRCRWEDRDGCAVGGGLGLDDPKHPAFHSVHADLYDNRADVREGWWADNPLREEH